IKYRFEGKEKLYSPGVYPAVTLEAARAERETVRGWLKEGRDPVQERQIGRAAATVASGTTFADVVAAWLAKQEKRWAPIHYKISSRAFERDVLPTLGKLPVDDITPAMLSGVVEAIVKRGTEDTAAKVLQHCGGVFRLAQARGLCKENPAIPVRDVLPRKKLAGRMPAFLDFPSLGGVLRAAETANLTPVVRMAHRLCAFTLARMSNIVEAEWGEFDLRAEPALWTIPRHKMKARDRHHDHKIVLSPAFAQELRAWQSLTGGQGYLFPSPAALKHITRESVEKSYRITLKLKDRHSPHGWRAAFSTLARDNGFERDVVELALDHLHDTDVVRAYDRGERMVERIRLMNWWGAELTRAQEGGVAVASPKRAA
ncbi:MAG: tyrosine-type recombinase/integrase, partial [bacterium]